ncbi:MAG TPA: TRAP transporter substrate-binding protein [Firmicutes bacterium]|nr:TRAP transporter substrate-binding protein [Bacillota bacterium]
MKKTRLTVGALLLVLSLVLAGCAGGGNGQGNTDTGSKAPVKIDLATIYDAKAPPTMGAAKFKELVEQRSNGAIKVNLFTNGALGSEKDTFNALSGNELQMILGGIQGVDQFAPQYMFITAPYLIKSWDHLRAILEGDLGQKMIQDLDKKNVHMLAVNYRGIRNTTSNKAFKKPDELKGLKLRLPEVASWVAAWKWLGAMPTPVALPELYGALQTKVVDASEGPYEQLATFKLYEVQKYIVQTQHVYEPCWLYISKSFLDSLPKEQQEIITSSAKEAMLYADQLAQEKAQEFLKELTDHGMQEIQPDLAAFQAAAKPMLDDMFKSTWTATTYDEVMQYSK